MGRGSGRRFVWISTKHRGVLSLWRDFFELTEVGRLTLDWFSILVGDYIDSTEIRGWRKTGRPKQVNDPSFTELKTIRCIIHGPLSEDIYNFTEMSKSSISSLFEVGMEAGRESEIADEEMDAVADARTFFSGFLLVDYHYFFPNHTRFSLIFPFFFKPNGFLGTHKSWLGPPLNYEGKPLATTSLAATKSF
ncbi:hypothetical protein Hanom_Chr09g00775281 [Helianthus anomalus]